eukprot:gene13360-9566_t
MVLALLDDSGYVVAMGCSNSSSVGSVSVYQFASSQWQLVNAAIEGADGGGEFGSNGNGNGNGNGSNGADYSSIPAPPAAAASVVCSLAAMPVTGGGSSTLVRTNTLISGKQHMNNTTRVVPVSQSAATSLKAPLPMPMARLGYQAEAQWYQQSQLPPRCAGPGRQLLSAVSQLQFNFQSSTANGVSG